MRGGVPPEPALRSPPLRPLSVTLSGFLSRLVLTPSGGRGDLWRLTEPLIYQGADDTFTVPRGFETDLASVPRLFWALFPPHGAWTLAAVVHDFLYVTGQVSRKDADGVFLRIMVASGTKLWRAAVMYRMVRWFGRGIWARKGSAPTE